MKRKAFNALRFAFYALGAIVVMTPTAHAYIDPATTSYVIQIIAGIVIACGTGIGIFLNRMKRKLRKKDEGNTEAAPERETQGGVMTAEDLLDGDETEQDS
ncbi:MAG: hypothetical protein IJ746_06985 [Ruminococcus sp.]|nr:hypothetical protein [Ruminococcus sp.]